MQNEVEVILAKIKSRGTLATNVRRQTDEDYLSVVDDIVSGVLVPLIASTNGEFFITSETTPLVAGVSEYRIPSRAVGRTLRELRMIEGGRSYQLQPKPVEDSLGWGSYGGARCFYFKGDKIILKPAVPANYSGDASLEMWFRLMPSRLVLPSRSARIVSVSDPTIEVTSIGAIQTGSKVDLVRGVPGYDVIRSDVLVTDVAQTTLSFGADVIPSDVRAGDWVSLSGEASVVTMLPSESMPLLISLACQRILSSIGDSQGASDLKEEIRDQKEYLLDLLTPRNEGACQKIVNPHSLIRGGYCAQAMG